MSTPANPGNPVATGTGAGTGPPRSQVIVTVTSTSLTTARNGATLAPVIITSFTTESFTATPTLQTSSSPAAPTPTNLAANSTSNSGLGTGGTIAIAVAVPIVVLSALACCFWFLFTRRRRRRSALAARKAEAEDYGYNPNAEVVAPVVVPVMTQHHGPVVDHDAVGGYRGWGATQASPKALQRSATFGSNGGRNSALLVSNSNGTLSKMVASPSNGSISGQSVLSSAGHIPVSSGPISQLAPTGVSQSTNNGTHFGAGLASAAAVGAVGAGAAVYHDYNSPHPDLTTEPQRNPQQRKYSGPIFASSSSQPGRTRVDQPSLIDHGSPAHSRNVANLPGNMAPSRSPGASIPILQREDSATSNYSEMPMPPYMQQPPYPTDESTRERMPPVQTVKGRRSPQVMTHSGEPQQQIRYPPRRYTYAENF